MAKKKKKTDTFEHFYFTVDETGATITITE